MAFWHALLFLSVGIVGFYTVAVWFALNFEEALGTGNNQRQIESPDSRADEEVL